MNPPLVFKPFSELKETFCREEYAGGVYFQKLISITQESEDKIEVKIMNDSSLGANGTAIGLSPKQVIVLRDLLALIQITENKTVASK